MKSISLIGFMGSGKTTIGKKLSEMLNIPYYDTDEEIEKWRNLDIPNIFSREGEENFRTYETKILLEMPLENAVVSTGGGIIEREENIHLLKNNFFTIYLDSTFDTISSRLDNDQTRPLWRRDLKEKMNLFEMRNPLYVTCATYTVNVDNKTVEQIVGEILQSINR